MEAAGRRRTNEQIARTLEFMGQLLEIAGEDAYRVRAYYRAAQEIERQGQPLAGRTEEELVRIRGIGKTLAKNIIEIGRTGTFPELEALRAGIPDTVIELLALNGVGPKTIHTLQQRLNIQSIEDLEKAAGSHRIRALKGFGERKEENIIRAIQQYRQYTGRVSRPEAEAVIGRVVAAFSPGRWDVAGSYRRGKSTIGDIDIVTTDRFASVRPKLRSLAEEMIDEGERKTSLRVGEMRVDIRFTEPGQYGSMLLYLTGSRDFNIRLREVAMARGYRMNEYGLLDRSTGVLHTFAGEEEMFEFLGMSPIPPELREDRGEIELALRRQLPELVDLPQMRGDLHVHTVWSDGRLSLEEVARAGDAMGYEYILVTDHAGTTRRCNAAALRKQRREIEEINADHSCQLLSGAEIDIRSDGSLSLPDRVLADLDLVVASVHSGFQQEQDVVTRKILSALDNEHVDIIGHPTGRLIGRRPPYDLDIARVIRRAAETGTALEINASPHRLDLDDIYIRQAKEHGVKLAIGSDSHRQNEFSNMHCGIMIARRGWCTAGDLINTFSLDELLEWSG
ncbi:MAG: DNA polymerase/3'-5' exonuclease PolX [Methanomicrobiaceae archaeon]|uniref:DNA polymerase beta n=1 Tax=hydrocarbon metagenome TaxID=938273 RepID=A0A0W8FIS4_9ZZZZ|nr:DNA polymerase/3'-5' exonuclease PolX [Methanomicrobiaceae archaeon]MDD5418387.1 DNA polymerase/3'-5' exonuclease PolX [Methanomicrobiaceae archaeon]